MAVEEYTGKLDIERRNIDQLTKQIEAMQAKLIEKVGAPPPPTPTRSLCRKPSPV